MLLPVGAKNIAAGSIAKVSQNNAEGVSKTGGGVLDFHERSVIKAEALAQLSGTFFDGYASIQHTAISTNVGRNAKVRLSFASPESILCRFVSNICQNQGMSSAESSVKTAG